jgi:hypothetical protein
MDAALDFMNVLEDGTDAVTVDVGWTHVEFQNG